MAAAQLENLVRIGQLQREAPVADELAGLKRSAESRIADATRPGLSFASRFDLAYNAAHALALHCLRRAGYRSAAKACRVSGAGPHVASGVGAVARIGDGAEAQRKAASGAGNISFDSAMGA